MTSVFAELTWGRKGLVAAGAVLLLLGALLFASKVLGFLPAGFLEAEGQSGLRPLAALAVGGCLCIAVGFWGK
jgi:hypothetical protein